MRLSASLLTTILLNMLLTWGCGQRSANSAGLTSSHANRRLQDLEVLCASIKENYPALETKRVQFGFDIDHACNNARISLAKLSIGNDLEFYRVLKNNA